MPRIHKRISLKEKFDARYRVCESGCWEWTGGTTRGGYGQVMSGGKNVRAHRAAYELYVGPIPDGMVVCHSCDNVRCVNPDHLWLGTHADNVADKMRKGRGLRGESQPAAKLTEADVRLIRQTKMNIREAAQRYGVSPVTAWKARERKIWKHVDA